MPPPDRGREVLDLLGGLPVYAQRQGHAPDYTKHVAIRAFATHRAQGNKQKRHFSKALPTRSWPARRRTHALRAAQDDRPLGLHTWCDLLPIARCAGPGGPTRGALRMKIATARSGIWWLPRQLEVGRENDLRLIPGLEETPNRWWLRRDAPQHLPEPPNKLEPHTTLPIRRRPTCWPQVRSRTEATPARGGGWWLPPTQQDCPGQSPLQLRPPP